MLSSMTSKEGAPRGINVKGKVPPRGINIEKSFLLNLRQIGSPWMIRDFPLTWDDVKNGKIMIYFFSVFKYDVEERAKTVKICLIFGRDFPPAVHTCLTTTKHLMTSNDLAIRYCRLWECRHYLDYVGTGIRRRKDANTFGNLVVGSNNSALEDRSGAFNCVGVNCADNM